MKNLEEKTIKSKRIYDGKIINLRVDDVELPDGNLSKREIVEHSGAVAVVAYHNSKVILVEQFRKGSEEVLLEIPAGKLDGEEEAIECARRELEEETGYRAKSMEWLCNIYTSPGFCNERIDIFLATGLTQYEQKLDEGEFLRVKELEIKEIRDMLAEGELTDAKTIVGLQYLMVRLGEE